MGKGKFSVGLKPSLTTNPSMVRRLGGGGGGGGCEEEKKYLSSNLTATKLD